MMENVYYVYAYLDPRKLGNFNYGEYVFDYEPFYIGKGKNDRKLHHLKMGKGTKIVTSNRHLISKIRNILSENKEPIIIEYKNELSSTNALILENRIISTIGRVDLRSGPLTNQADGGERQNFNLSVESREKISTTLKGNIPWNKGKTGIYSDETRAKISKSLTGRKGTPLSDYQKLICSQTHKNKKVSLETRQKQSESHKGHIPWNTGTVGVVKAWNKGISIPRKIYKFLLNNELIIINDLKTYCKNNDVSYGSLLAVDKGRYKSCKGYTKYYE